MVTVSCSFLENAVDDSLLDDDHRIVSDATYLQVVHKFITSEEVAWATPELRDTMLFAWGVLLRECGSRLVFAGRSGQSRPHPPLSFIPVIIL